MSNMRLRRLQSDYERVRRLVRMHPRIDIEGVQGNPPERYRFILAVSSLSEKGGVLSPALQHRLEVTLPHGYPRDAPTFRMLTPVFHPNIAPHAVCIGDHWSAGESLDHLVQRVGEMLSYQSYNVQSPLNGKAAQWVAENPHQVPTDRREFFLDLATESTPTAAGPAQCDNCGAANPLGTAWSVAAGPGLWTCRAGHSLCTDCQVGCTACQEPVCLICEGAVCAKCAASAAKCSNCAAPVAAPDPCPRGHFACADCDLTCPRCRLRMCLICDGTTCRRCGVAREDALV